MKIESHLPYGASRCKSERRALRAPCNFMKISKQNPVEKTHILFLIVREIHISFQVVRSSIGQLWHNEHEFDHRDTILQSDTFLPPQQFVDFTVVQFSIPCHGYVNIRNL